MKELVIFLNAWSFSCNSFVKFHGKKIWEPQCDCVYPIYLCFNEVCYKGMAPYYVTHWHC